MIEARALTRLTLGPINLTVDDGECVSVMGRSGAGKSILLRMLADLDPHGGEALLDGVRCTSMAASAWRAMVTYVPAESGWWAERVGDHFTANDPAKNRQPAMNLLPAMGFPENAFEWPISRLSTGERQRLAVLRALQSTTRVLLMDEPTSGLDAASIGLVEALLRDRLASGMSIVLVTHDPEQAMRMACRRFEVREGQLVGDVR
jgi:ABC-type iron transport system FetAB ATPase subunit